MQCSGLTFQFVPYSGWESALYPNIALFISGSAIQAKMIWPASEEQRSGWTAEDVVDTLKNLTIIKDWRIEIVIPHESKALHGYLSVIDPAIRKLSPAPFPSILGDK